jgi:competence protein ComEA
MKIEGSSRVRGRALRMLAALAVAAAGLGADPALAAEAKLSGVVNLNTATQEELLLLPGIGEARARAVIEARKQRGGFKSVEELMEVKGIGPAGFEKLRPHLAIEGKTTAQRE